MDESTALLSSAAPRSLAELVRERGAVPVPQALALMRAIAQALVSATETKGAQPPLQAQNIRVTWVEAGDPVIVLVEGDGTVDLTHGADVFSLGVIAFTVFAGRPPSLDETLADAMPSVPAGVDRLVAKLLARVPAERPTAAQAFKQLQELTQALAEPSVKTAAPLSALPLIKRGPPIEALRTDSKAWQLDTRDESTRLVSDEPRLLTSPAPDINPFADDEATATVKAPVSADDEEELTRQQTQMSATEKWPLARSSERPAPLPHETQPGEDEEPFEATKRDLMGRSPDAKPVPLKPKAKKPASAQEQLLALVKQQPPWVFGGIGVALAFVVLLIILLAR